MRETALRSLADSRRIFLFPAKPVPAPFAAPAVRAGRSLVFPAPPAYASGLRSARAETYPSHTMFPEDLRPPSVTERRQKNAKPDRRLPEGSKQTADRPL